MALATLRAFDLQPSVSANTVNDDTAKRQIKIIFIVSPGASARYINGFNHRFVN